MTPKQIASAFVQLFAYIVAGVTHAVSIALLLLIAWAVAAVYGLRVPKRAKIDSRQLDLEMYLAELEGRQLAEAAE